MSVMAKHCVSVHCTVNNHGSQQTRMAFDKDGLPRTFGAALNT